MWTCLWMEVRRVNKIRRLLSIGDLIYPIGGKPVKVTGIFSNGFSVENGYFTYDEHRERYFLTDVERKAQNNDDTTNR